MDTGCEPTSRDPVKLIRFISDRYLYGKYNESYHNACERL